MRKGLNQQTILNIFDNLKHNLTQNNSINMTNLHSLNANFEIVCKYAKQGFKALTETILRQKQIILQLTNTIKNHGLDSKIEHLYLELHSNPELNELNQSITDFIASKNENTNDHQYLQTGIKHSKLQKSKSRDQSIIKPNKQKYLFDKFVNNHIKGRLEYTTGIGSQIPKSLILNNFIKYCQHNNYRIDPGQYSKIQMALTNYIKNVFPKASQTLASYRGLRFKQQYPNAKREAQQKQQYFVQDT